MKSMPPDEQYTRTVRRQLERVLSSAGFARSERLSQFLRFVVEQHLGDRDAETKEALIAVEVFGRKPDYDPKQDSIVRTEAGRLRSRLIEYYAGEGSGDSMVIELPKGSYVPVLRRPAAAPVVEERHPGISSARSGLAWAVAGLAIVLAGLGWWWVRHSTAPIAIAVLPLDNLNRDPASDYFADGLTDELIRNLSIIEGLAVRSQTSSFALKGKGRSVREMGLQLHADYILEGSVLRIGRQLRIDTQLVRVRDDFTLWSARFDRPWTDIFAIQDEISVGIVNNLRLRLGRGRRRYETNLAAYDLYLRGRSLQINMGIRGFDQSIGPFERVVAMDPSFAPAYAGLGTDYAIRSIQFPVDHPPDELPKMRAAAEKAIRLDPLLPAAHEALALSYARDGRWAEAEESFRRAIEIDPNRSSTHANYAFWLLYVLGRNREALEELHIAERADPLSPEIQRDLAVLLISVGRNAEAVDSYLNPSADPVFKAGNLGWARLGQGRTSEAIGILENAPDLRTNPRTRGLLGNAYARSGHSEEAEKLANASSYASEQVLIFAGLGDKDRTLEALDRMAILGPQRIGMFINSPELAFVRREPRLKALRRKVGLPE
jgi:serine/threonine-protein kinase